MTAVSEHIYSLGLNLGHNATACLVRDGDVIACVSEERFVGAKNFFGYPEQSVNWVLQSAGIEPSDLNAVVPQAISPFLTVSPEAISAPRSGLLRGCQRNLHRAIFQAADLFPAVGHGYRILYDRFYQPFNLKLLSRLRDKSLAAMLGVPVGKIITFDHHLLHAAAAKYATLDQKSMGQEWLAVTLDGFGDTSSGMVARSINHRFELEDTTSIHNSLGSFYEAITQHLGMKPQEHEYKVMGLAPYAHPDSGEAVYERLESLIWRDGLSVATKLPSIAMLGAIRRAMAGRRFDDIAYGAQKIVEEICRGIVEEAVRITGIPRVLLGGGVFMNVKANGIIGASDLVEDLKVCPSASDESSAIGAAFLGYVSIAHSFGREASTRPLEHLYLGPSFDEVEIDRFLASEELSGLNVNKLGQSINDQISELLAAGEIVARFDGAAEWGARALGNRSILANPSMPEVVSDLNSKIKSRDFWMPFAGTIMKRFERDVLVNPKNLDARFMCVAFPTKAEYRNELRAAMHPADKTMRPQVLQERDNPAYWRILDGFHSRTGIPGILNTSFNLHGEPIVGSPGDALRTLRRSGLRHLALGPYLITKEGSS